MEQNHEYFDKVLKLILEENNLKIKKIPEVRKDFEKKTKKVQNSKKNHREKI